VESERLGIAGIVHNSAAHTDEPENRGETVMKTRTERSTRTFTRMTVFVIATLVFLSAVACSARAQTDPARKDWIQLFNGKDLQGWDIKLARHELNDNYADTFRVEGGVLKAAYDKYPKFGGEFGHIFYRQKFSYYVVAAEYRFVGTQTPAAPEWAERNSGIMVHCQSPGSMRKDQDFPISIEVQLLGGLGKGSRTTANLCTPGTNVEQGGKLITAHCVSSRSKTYDGDQWVRVEAMVLGGEKVKHMIDGQVVLEYEHPQIGGGNVENYDPAVKQDGRILTEGYISLQGESHPVEFRKVELLNLAGCMDPKADNYKSYFVKAENQLCRYKGKPAAR
jgi:hypothetical protein